MRILALLSLALNGVLFRGGDGVASMITRVDVRCRKRGVTFGIRRRLQAPASTLFAWGFSLILAGCYSVVTINLGSANHEAASSGKPLAPEVLCASLAHRGIKTKGLTVDGSDPCGSTAVAK